MDFNKLNRGDLNNLQNQDLDFDKEAMWSNLENRKKKRPFFWWMSIGSGIGLILLGATYFYFSQETAFKKPSQIVDNQYIEETKVTETKLSENSKIELVEEEAEQLNVKNENELLSNHSTEIKSKIDSDHKNKAEENFTFTSKDNFETGNNYQIQTNRLQKPESKIFSNEIIRNSKINEKINSEKIDLAEAIDFKKAILKIEIDKDLELPKTVSSKLKRSKPHSLLITPFAGVGYQFRSLEMKEGQRNSEQLTRKKSNEKPHESWSFGLLIDKKLGNHLMLGTGFEFLQHNEQLTLYEYETNNIEGFAFVEIPDEFMGQEGFLTKKTSFIYQNQYRLLNVPVSISWLLHSKKLRLAPTASLIFNINQKSIGHIEIEEGVATDVAPFLKSQVGLAYRFGCRMYYPLNNGLMLFANPQFEINPSDISQSLNPISQKRNLVKIDIGVTKQFKY